MSTIVRIPWNKGLKGKQSWHNISGLGKNIDYKKRGQSISKSMTGMKRSEEYKEDRAMLMKIKWSDPEYRNNQIKSQTGKKLSIEHRRKLGEANKGEKSHLWKGGVTELYHITRNCFEYRQWRTLVFQRDNYTCLECGDNKGGNLEADHIIPFIVLLKNEDWETMFNIENGRTLCKDCHMQTITWGYRVHKLIRNGGLT